MKIERHEMFEKMLKPFISDGDDVQALVTALNNIFVHGDIVTDNHTEKEVDGFLKKFYQGIDTMEKSVNVLNGGR